MKFINIRDVCFAAIFAAIIAVCAQIYIPMPMVPVTLQTFAVALAGIILGAKRGALSALVYILLGMTGVPVFSKFMGGFAVIFGPTGGFILSFPIMALCVGIFSDLSTANSNKKLSAKSFLITAGLVLGAAINYAGGLLMFCAATSGSIKTAFAACVTPFLFPDIIKLVLAGIIGASVKKILIKSKIL